MQMRYANKAHLAVVAGLRQSQFGVARPHHLQAQNADLPKPKKLLEIYRKIEKFD